MKTLGAILAVLGIVCMIFGVFYYQDWIKLPMAISDDPTPPDILMKTPFKKIVLSSIEARELVTIVQDIQSNISLVLYYDKFYTNGLVMVKSNHPPSWLPQKTLDVCDFNGDWAVNHTDLDMFNDHVMSYPGDPEWDVKYDLNKDDACDIKDYFIFAKSYGKYLYTTTHNSIQFIDKNTALSFYIKATNEFGYESPVYSSTVTVTTSGTGELLGRWYVNNVIVNSTNNVLNLTSTNVEVKFVSSYDLPSKNTTVTYTINGKTYPLSVVNSKTYKGSFPVDKTTNIILSASVALVDVYQENSVLIYLDVPLTIESKVWITIGIEVVGLVMLMFGVGVYLKSDEDKRKGAVIIRG